MKNIAIAARRELQAHRRFDTGVTASRPTYKAIDTVGNKDWVADVYLGPLDPSSVAIARDVLIAPYARQLVTDVRQPVLLERSKQGKPTIVGRAKIMPGGAQMPEGSILEPNYNRIEYNLAELGLMFIADLEVDAEYWGEKEWGSDPDAPWQQFTFTDAFGNVVVGADVDPADIPPALAPDPAKTTTTKHVVLTAKTWGPGGDLHALAWGTDEWGASDLVTVELVT